MEIEETIQMLFSDGSASKWFKMSLSTALERDPIDALNDAKVLVKILDHKVRNIQQVEMFRVA